MRNIMVMGFFVVVLAMSILSWSITSKFKEQNSFLLRTIEQNEQMITQNEQREIYIQAVAGGMQSIEKLLETSATVNDEMLKQLNQIIVELREKQANPEAPIYLSISCPTLPDPNNEYPNPREMLMASFQLNYPKGLCSIATFLPSGASPEPMIDDENKSDFN